MGVKWWGVDNVNVSINSTSEEVLGVRLGLATSTEVNVSINSTSEEVLGVQSGFAYDRYSLGFH